VCVSSYSAVDVLKLTCVLAGITLDTEVDICAQDEVGRLINHLHRGRDIVFTFLDGRKILIAKNEEDDLDMRIVASTVCGFTEAGKDNIHLLLAVGSAEEAEELAARFTEVKGVWGPFDVNGRRINPSTHGVDDVRIDIELEGVEGRTGIALCEAVRAGATGLCSGDLDFRWEDSNVSKAGAGQTDEIENGRFHV